MNAFARIRKRLGLSQAAIADQIGVSQGNVSFYETRNQTVPPEVGRRLIEFGRRRGLRLSFDHLYADAELPPELCAAPSEPIFMPTLARDTAPERGT